MLTRPLAFALTLIAATVSWSPVGARPSRQAEAAWLRTESRRFEIHYQRALAADLDRVVRSAETAYNQIAGRLNFVLATKVPLVVFAPAGRMTQDEYEEAIAELDRLCGDDDGRGAREFALRNTMMALTAFMLVAQGEGLATGPMGGFDEARLKAAFELPAEWVVAAVCALGYPDEEFDRTLRKPLGDIVHWDRHGGARQQPMGTGSTT